MITIDLNKIFTDNNVALGNHMFKYAICRLVAQKNGYNFHVPLEGYLKNCFPEIYLGNQDGYVRQIFSEDISKQSFNEGIFNIPDFTSLDGFFQTDKYYKSHESDVKSWFRIFMDDNVNSNLKKYPIEKYCFIHIRGGDNRNTSRWLISKKYYEDAVNKMKSIKNDIELVIITDDWEL